MEDTFRWRVNVLSPATLSHTSLPPQPAPPTPACYLRFDSPSRSLVQICTDAVSKTEAPRERCATHTVLCPPASVDEVFYARFPAAALCISRPTDESLIKLAVYFRNWHMFREYMNNIAC